MAFIVEAGTGWLAGKIFDAALKTLMPYVSEIIIRGAISSSIEVALKYANENSSITLKLTDLEASNSDIRDAVFQSTLAALKNVSSDGATIHEISIGIDNISVSPEWIHNFSNKFDDELWRNTSLTMHRSKVSQRITETGVTQLVSELIVDNSYPARLYRARVGGLDLVNNWISRKKLSTNPIERRVYYSGNKDRDPVNIEDLSNSISAGWRGLIVDVGGAGKTTYLSQLAQHLMTVKREFCCIVINCREVAAKRSVLKAITDSSSMSLNDVDDDDIRHIAKAGGLVILCDAWNELNEEERGELNDAFESLELEFDKISIGFSTRPLTLTPPLGPYINIELDRISKSDQDQYILNQSGEKAVSALRDFRELANAQSILQIPFFLYNFAIASSSTGGIANRENLVSASVEVEHNRAPHINAAPPLRPARLNIILQSLAVNFISSRNTEVPEDVVLTSLEGIMDQTPVVGHDDVTPHHLLEHLTSHSFLRSDTIGNEKFVGFSHELVRDWFASLLVELDISRDVELAVRKYGNHYDWEDTLKFAVERMSNYPEPHPTLSTFLKCMVGVDPLFAADLISLTSDESWLSLQRFLEQFLDGWSYEPDKKRKFAFIVHLGRKEFSGRIWDDLLSRDKSQDQGITRSHRFKPSVLGDDWREKIYQLATEAERSIIYDLTYYGGDQGLEMAVQYVIDNANYQHLGSLLAELEYSERSDLYENLLLSFSTEKWNHWSLVSDFSIRVPSSLDAPLRTALDRHAEGTDDQKRVKARLLLAKRFNEPISRETADCALELEANDRDLQGWFSEDLSKLDPGLFAEVVIQRFLANAPISSYASRHIIELNDNQQKALCTFVLSGNVLSYSFPFSNLLSAQSLKAILGKLHDIRAELTNTPSNVTVRNLYHSLKSILCSSNEVRFANLMIQAKPKSLMEIDTLLDLVSRWSTNDVDQRGLSLKNPYQLVLSKRVVSWIEVIKAERPLNRRRLADASVALSKVGPSSVALLIGELLLLELHRHKEERVEAEKLTASRRGTESFANMYYDNLFVQSFDRLKSENAKSVLLDFLNDDRFVVHAAICLTKYCRQPTLEIFPKERTIWGANFNTKRERRKAYAEQMLDQAKCSVLAGQIVNRMNYFWAKPDAKSKSIALKLANSAIWMNLGSRVSEVFRILQDNCNPRENLSILKSMDEVGIRVRSEFVLPALEEVEKEWFAQEWHHENELWRIKDWLKLLAVSESPALLPKRIGQYKEPLSNYRISDLILEIDADDPDLTLRTAIEFCDETLGLNVSSYERSSCLHRIGTDDALKLILRDHLTGKSEMHWISPGFVQTPLVVKLDNDQAFFDLAIAEVEACPDTRLAAEKFGQLASGFQHMSSFERLVEIIQKEGVLAGPLEAALHEMMKNLCVSQESLGGNMYSLSPRGCGDLRLKLWNLIKEDRARSKLWKKMLSRTDEFVAEYGQHPNDPRHPCLADNMSWPYEAPSVLEVCNA